MSKKHIISVLIVDDHDLVRAGIRRILDDNSGIKVVGESDSGENAVKMARELTPDVVLMDLKMPGVGGLEATRKILHYNPDVKILVVTACTDNMFPSRLLQVGVAGYLTKDASSKEMVQAIQNVYLGQRYISPEIAQQLVLNKIGNDNKSPFDELSSRELQVALMIANGYKVQYISDKLNLSPKTVNSYRYRVFDKLGIKGDVELTHLAIQHGLVET